MPTGNKTGQVAQQASCGAIGGSSVLALSGSSNPSYGVTAPAGLIGTVATNGASAATLALNDPSQTVTTSTLLAVFWTTSGGTILNACYDLAVASVSFSSPTNTATITQSGSVPTTGKFWASSGSAPTALPTATTPITAAINQDVTLANEGVSIPGGTGGNIQQLMAISTQIGLVEWLKASGSTQERLSAILAANSFDVWPLSSSQLGSLPSGGAGNNWTSGDTVTVIRFYNLGSTLVNVGVGSVAASMQAGALLT